MGRKKYPMCLKCGKVTEIIGSNTNGNIYGCKTPTICGYKEYEVK